MDNYVYVGKVINTFGIKGELKIESDFLYKERCFVNNFTIYLGESKIKEKINNHYVHKNNEIVLLDGYNNINDVLKYKGIDVFVLRDDLKLSKEEYLLEDLINYEVYDEDKMIGKVIDFSYSKSNILLRVSGEKEFFIPMIDVYIKKIDSDNKRIITNKGSDLIL